MTLDDLMQYHFKMYDETEKIDSEIDPITKFLGLQDLQNNCLDKLLMDQ